MFCFLLLVLIIVSCLITFLYVYISYNYDYWKKKKVPFIQPSFPFGNFGDVIMGRKSFIDLSIEQYRQFPNERYFGVFDFGTPVLVIRDPVIVEKLLVSDFPVFCNKRVDSSSMNNEFFAKFLGGMQDQDWRDLRMKLNTAFSYNKLKQIFDNISSNADDLVSKINVYHSNNEEATAKSLSSLFSYKAITSSLFGFECDDSFYNLLMNTSKKTFIRFNILECVFTVFFYVPKLVNLLFYIPSVNKVLKFYKDLSLAAVKARKDSSGRRSDILQILLDLKNNELKNNRENPLHSDKTGKDQILPPKCTMTGDYSKSDEDGFITAQVFSFMCLGANGLTTALAVLLTDLASNPSVQTKVQAEIDEMLIKTKEISPNTLQQLKYLDAVIQESLRLNPGFAGPLRTCSSPYTLPGTDLVLETGTTVMIPTCGIHLDPNNHPDPELFLPERFIDNNFKTSGAYLPFGAGPRICLVYRLVILMLKVAVTKVLCKYSLRLSPNAKLPLRYKASFLGILEDELWLKFEPRISIKSMNTSE
ncbi:cytochrome P450 6B5-like [Macrosteles quadrilineatus]|uniref:cytochrome P450 6B5-like n=1 Tax=Macrosteles quadrilineatus TaxID=74068 RepID=UPI0023E327EB|nr:cytochrome P450 6B5-like [Macrosteles quadrilineatus]